MNNSTQSLHLLLPTDRNIQFFEIGLNFLIITTALGIALLFYSLLREN